MEDLIDSHCHLDFKVFDNDRDRVVERAHQAGIKHIIIPGVERSAWEQIRSFSERNAGIHACYGLHPYMAAEHTEADIKQLRHWVQQNSCVAVGECGLDYRKGQADRDLQMEIFTAQLAIAQTCAKPVVIHSVRATADVISAIKDHPGLHGMVHSYSGSYEQARQLQDLGFYTSLGGAITYTNASKLRTTASKIPLESILLETDAPDQPDASHHGERNEPAYLLSVLKCLGELRKESIEEIAAQTTKNAQELFGI
jgi:TatD DNase family protein